MITLDMNKKADRVRITDGAFTLENGVLTLQISLGSYSLTGKTVTAAFSPNLVETGSLVVTEGVVALPISPSLVAAGNNHIQLNIRTSTTLEQSPIMLWQVGKSILATGTPTDDPGILDGILGDIAQAQIDIDALELGKVDKVAGKALSTNDFTDAFETKLTDLPLAADLTISLGGKVDKVTGKELSDNNYTDAEVLIVADVVNKVDKVAGYALSQNDFTDALESKLNGIEALADVTDSGNVSAVLHGATVKATPIDADTLAYTDTQASNVVKKATWANVKAFLKTYFDSLYQTAIAYTTENVSNKKTTLTDNSDTFYPSQKAVKTAVDLKLDTNGTADALTFMDTNSHYTIDTVKEALVQAGAEIDAIELQLADVITENQLGYTTIPTSSTSHKYPLSYELGAVLGDGTLSVSTTRIRLTKQMFFKAGTVLSLTDKVNYAFSLTSYSTTGFLSQLAYQTADYTVPANTWGIIVVRKGNNGDLTGLVGETAAKMVVSLSKSNIAGESPKKNKFMHFSFDDVFTILTDLTTNVGTYTSIFDNSNLAFLKEMHDSYGAVFSLYCYYTDGTTTLAQKTRNFASEFRENSNWLKFGFHAYNSGSDYNAVTATQGRKDYLSVMHDLYDICGGIEALDKVPRIHYFYASSANIDNWKNDEISILGLLSADDTRTSYHLTAAQVLYLQTHSKLYDTVKDLTIFSTDLRFENFADPTAEMEMRYHDEFYLDRMDWLVNFTHEWALDAGMRTKIENSCLFANEYGYKFDFPMNHI